MYMRCHGAKIHEKCTSNVGSSFATAAEPDDDRW